MAAEHLIYGTEGSPFVRKVLVSHEEKGLDWELEEVNVFDPPGWFKHISPAQRIPVLKDRSLEGDETQVTIADSSAICAYLERKFAAKPLYPSTAIDLGRALWFEEYADTLLAARIGFGLLRTLIAAPQNGAEPDLDRANKTLRVDLPPLLDYLNQTIGQRQWLVGEQLSVADIAVGAQLAGLQVTRVGLDQERWPDLARYTQELLARPSFTARLDAVAHLSPSEPLVHWSSAA